MGIRHAQDGGWGVRVRDKVRVSQAPGLDVSWPLSVASLMVVNPSTKSACRFKRLQRGEGEFMVTGTACTRY